MINVGTDRDAVIQPEVWRLAGTASTRFLVASAELRGGCGPAQF
jgi:hypothetical protein